MKCTLSLVLIGHLFASAAWADEGPKAPPATAFHFTLDGQPIQPTVASLSGTPERPQPGDLVWVGGFWLTLGTETTCEFRSTPKEDGRLFLHTKDGKERVVGARVGWTFENDKKIVLNPLARLSDLETRGLWGVEIDEWNEQVAERLGNIDRHRTCVTITGNAKQGPKGALPDLPKGLAYLDVESIYGDRFADFSRLREQKELRFLAVHTPGEFVDVRDLGQCRRLNVLELSGNSLRNVAKLGALTELRSLNVAYAREVDALAFAARLSRLVDLDIRGTQARDLTPLDELKYLRCITASRAPIGALPRGALPELRQVRVLSTALTDQAVAAFIASHPRCRVESHWMPVVRDALAGANRLRVRSGGTCCRDPKTERTLFEIKGAQALGEVLDRIEIDEGHAEFSCMCCGDPSFEFYRDAELVLTIGFHHGQSVRWLGGWPGDGALAEASADSLCQWLADNGAPGALEQRTGEKKGHRAAQRRSRRYAELIPEAVLDSLRKSQSQEQAVAAFQAASDDPVARARIFARSFGCDEGSWNLYSGLDDLLKEVLLPKVTQGEWLAVLTDDHDPAILNGAGRWLYCEQKWKSLDKKALKAILPEVARFALGHPREINRRMTMRALFEAPDATGIPLLRCILDGSIPVRKLAESEADEPGGMVMLRPGDDEITEGSDQAVAALLLAKRGDKESLLTIRRLARTAAGEDKAILDKALQMLEGTEAQRSQTKR
jgi:hypothetical protein